MMMMMAMKLLSGMMVIKTQGLKNKDKRRVNVYCLASIKMVGLVYS